MPSLDILIARTGPTAARGGQPLLADAAAPMLRRGRVHEFCGAARRTLAALVMQADTAPDAPILWIAAGWQADRLCPDGLVAFTNPGRLILVAGRREADLLWAMEEALRSGAAPLIVADLASPPGLTPIRRLHLAAEAGAQRANGPAPLGVILTPGTGGAAGVESRWHLAPCRGGWHLDRLRARLEPPKSWHILRHHGGVHLAPASPGTPGPDAPTNA